MGLFQWIKRLFTRAPEKPYGVSPFPPGTGPSRLIVLRHAEKTGDKRNPHLSLPGKRRAENLVAYIPATFGQPQFLIAVKTSKRSRRPVATLEPLAAALALEITAKLDDDETSALVRTLRNNPRYRGKVGVISWRHSELPGLAAALGAVTGAYPKRWDENDYTTIIDITYQGNGEVWAKRLQMPF